MICSRALNGALQIGQLLAWYLRESAQPLHRHKCLQGKIKVSRTSHIQITHSAPLSSVSSSLPCCYLIKIYNYIREFKEIVDTNFDRIAYIKYRFSLPLSSLYFCFQCHKFLEVNNINHQHIVFVWEPSIYKIHQSVFQLRQ